MSKGVIFWVLMILWLIFGLWTSWATPFLIGGHVLTFVLLALLGWQVFGPPIR